MKHHLFFFLGFQYESVYALIDMINLAFSDTQLVYITIDIALFSTHQCLGSPTPSVWPTSAPCGVMSLSSSASSPQSSRSMSVWYPGRKTLSLSCQVGKKNPVNVIKKYHLHKNLATHPLCDSTNLSVLLKCLMM